MAFLQCVLAIGVMQVASILPSPLREILLFFICLGVLWGGALVEQASKLPSDGPEPPSGWSWKLRGKAKRADGEEEEADEADSFEPEVLMLASKTKKAKKSLGVALVPGNPGVPHYYCEFGEEIQKAFDTQGLASPTIYCVGYKNFPTCAEGAAVRQKSSPASLEQESTAIGEVLVQLQELHPDGFVILGHSIGAWIVLQTLKLVNDRASPVPLAVLAMPYLEYRPFSMQTLMRVPLSLARLVALTATALPSRLKALLALPLSHNPRGSLAYDVTLKTFLCQPHQLSAVVGLYHTECSRLDPAKQGQGFSECKSILSMEDRPPVLALFTKGDMWAPMEHFYKLKGLLSDRDEIVDLSADPTMKGLKAPSHSFVLSRQHCQSIAGLVAASMAKR